MIKQTANVKLQELHVGLVAGVSGVSLWGLIFLILCFKIYTQIGGAVGGGGAAGGKTGEN